MPKLWFINNLIIEAGLCAMILGSYSLFSIYIASLLVLIVIGIEIYIITKEKL